MMFLIQIFKKYDDFFTIQFFLSFLLKTDQTPYIIFY
jgi:hypothetical protein